MDKDATRYEGRPQSRRHRVRWGPSSPPRKGGTAAPNYRPTAGWIKMPLGTEVGLGPGHIILDGDWAPNSLPPKGQSPLPIFGQCLLWQNGGWIKMPLGMEVDISLGHIVLDGDPAPPPQKGALQHRVQPTTTVAKRLPIAISTEHLLHSSRQKVPILYNGRPFPKNCPFPWEDLDPHLIYDSLVPSESITQIAT